MDKLESITVDSCINNTQEILKLLSDDEVWRSIPLISNMDNFDRLKDMQLVRFSGLVQDMLDHELYLDVFQTKIDGQEPQIRNGKYRDDTKLELNEEIILDSPVNVHKERQIVFMVSVPGLNDWAMNVERQNQADCEVSEVKEGNCNKRSLDAKQTAATDNANDNEMDTDDGSSLKKIKKTDDTKSTTETPALSREYLLNSPIADRPSRASLIKLYDSPAALSLNDVIDVVGFLSTSSSLCGSNQAFSDFDNANEVYAMNPPPSLIPRIHVITYRSVNHLNPLLLDSQPTVFTDTMRTEINKDLKNVLTQCLFGDSVAADYLLCHLISTVYIRGNETLGQFSINLTNFPPEVLPNYTKQLYEILEMILPASHYFPVTVDNLNTMAFIPTKDYETGRLTSGLLQLAPHTHLVLDETRLEPGKLEQQGIEAVAHISNLIRKQQLNVNFKFYTIDYDVNIPVLVLSEGKSLFPSNCHIPIKSDPDWVRLINENFVALRQFLKPKLDTIRAYLTTLRLQKFEMESVNVEMIQSDFVEMRRDFNATADDLHMLLILSRMLGIIQGKTTLDSELWSQAKAMENERRQRIQEFGGKQSNGKISR